MNRTPRVAIVATFAATMAATMVVTTHCPRDASANPTLKEAQRLLNELYVEKAGKKFEEALEEGTSDAGTTAQIYMGLGEVAASLDKPKAAFDHFKKAFAIDTLLDLRPGTSPKVSEPLQKARGLFRKDKRKLELAVNIDTAEGVAASATILSDPFDMVAGISVEAFNKDGDSETNQISTDSETIPIPLNADAEELIVSLIDEHGNRLVTNDKILLPEGERVGGGGVTVSSGGAGKSSPGTDDTDNGSGGAGFLTNWKVWAGLTVVSGAVAGSFGVSSLLLERDLKKRSENSSDNEFSEVLELKDKAEQRALIANIGFGVTGVFAAATVLFFVLDMNSDEAEAEKETALAPIVGPNQLGVSATLRF